MKIVAALLIVAFAAQASASPSRALKFGAPPPDVDECMIENGGCSHCCTNYDYLLFDFSFKCSCPDGWTMGEDEATCSQDLKCGLYGCSDMCTETEGLMECIPSPDPVCSCPGCGEIGGFGEGFVLGLDMKTCENVNECTVNNGGCSDICVDTPGCYHCECPGCTTAGLVGDGFVLDDDLMTCLDVDECAVANGGCTDICVNTPGCFFCECPGCWNEDLGDGFVLAGDGYTCLDIDECAVFNGGCSDICLNNAGCYECACTGCQTPGSLGDGFVLGADLLTCLDIDECAVGNGGCDEGCVNTPGCHFCTCPGCAEGMGDGFVLAGDLTSCLDIDECATGNAGCSDSCINTPGCYECGCPGCTTTGLTGDGFVLGLDAHTCLDVDECAVNNGGCSDVCVNTPGCFYCECLDCGDESSLGSGFVLAGDSLTCVDVDECAVGNGGCSHGCTNTPGCFECSCPGCEDVNSQGNGYVLDDDLSTCVDIDECASTEFPNAGCSDFCINTPGCFECGCPPACDDPELPQPAGGYELDGFTCIDIDECSNTGWEGACAGICENTPGCYQCISADVTTDYKMSLTLIMHDYEVAFMDETVFAQMVADTIGVDPQYIQIDAVEQVGADTEVSFTWYALDATTFVTLLLSVEQIDWVPVLIEYMQQTLPAGAF